MRLSQQMQKILLTLLKAEGDLESVVGEHKDHYWRLGEPRLDNKELARFIVGEKTLYGESKYVKDSVEVSLGRSLRRLEDWGFIDVLRQTSPGYHGYLYTLTEKGKLEAQRIQTQIVGYINEFERFL